MDCRGRRFKAFYSFDIRYNPVEYLYSPCKESLGKFNWCYTGEQVARYVNDLKGYRATFKKMKCSLRSEEYERILILKYISSEVDRIRVRTHRFFDFEQAVYFPFFAIYLTLLRREDVGTLTREVFPGLSSAIKRHFQKLTPEHVKLLRIRSLENLKTLIDNAMDYLESDILNDQKRFKTNILSEDIRTYIVARLQLIKKNLSEGRKIKKTKVTPSVINSFLKQSGVRFDIFQIRDFLEEFLGENVSQYMEVQSQYGLRDSSALRNLMEIKKRIRSLKQELGSKFSFIPSKDKIHLRRVPVFMKHMVPVYAVWPIPTRENESELLVQSDLKVFRNRKYYETFIGLFHELYPGHHTQVNIAQKHQPLIAFSHVDDLIVEGWGKFSEVYFYRFTKSAKQYGLIRSFVAFAFAKTVLDYVIEPRRRKKYERFFSKYHVIPESKFCYFFDYFVEEFAMSAALYPAGYMEVNTLIQRAMNKCPRKTAFEDTIDVFLRHSYLPLEIIEKDIFKL